MLILREQQKPEFAFLQHENPYRPYYDHKVAEISKKIVEQVQGAIDQPVVEPKKEPEIVAVKIEELNINQQKSNFLEKIFEEIKEPDP